MKRLFKVTMYVTLEDISEGERAIIADRDGVPVDDLATVDDISNEDLTQILETVVSNTEYQKTFCGESMNFHQLMDCTIDWLEEEPTMGRRIGVDGNVTHVDLTIPRKSGV